MPAGRLVAWVVQTSGPVNWTLAATVTLVLQLLASAAAWWMLTTLFGVRWSVLAPYALYLTSALTFPAVMWWAAALTLVPVQASFFASTAAWVTPPADRPPSWLWCTLGCLVAGLAFDVKAALIVPVLFFVGLAYFESRFPGPAARPFVRSRWVATVALCALLVTYATYYLTSVPTSQVSSDGGRSRTSPAPCSARRSRRGCSVDRGGGPTRRHPRRTSTRPAGRSTSPGSSSSPSWLLRSCGSSAPGVPGCSWPATSSPCSACWRHQPRRHVRLPIGLEHRYLTDAACVARSASGWPSSRSSGAVGSIEPRQKPLLTRAAPRASVPVLTALVVASVAYQLDAVRRYWHHDNASQSYLHNLAGRTCAPTAGSTSRPAGPKRAVAAHGSAQHHAAAGRAGRGRGVLPVVLAEPRRGRGRRWAAPGAQIDARRDVGPGTDAQLRVAASPRTGHGPARGAGLRVDVVGPHRLPGLGRLAGDRSRRKHPVGDLGAGRASTAST